MSIPGPYKGSSAVNLKLCPTRQNRRNAFTTTRSDPHLASCFTTKNRAPARSQRSRVGWLGGVRVQSVRAHAPRHGTDTRTRLRRWGTPPLLELTRLRRRRSTYRPAGASCRRSGERRKKEAIVSLLGFPRHGRTGTNGCKAGNHTQSHRPAQWQSRRIRRSSRPE